MAESRVQLTTAGSRLRVGASELKLQFGITAILIGLWALFVIGSPGTFLSFSIYASFMSTIPFQAIMALSLTLVVISGEIDLSFASVMGFAGWIFSFVFANTGSGWLALVICLITGMFAGFVNGLLVVKLGLPSLVATVGTMYFWRGAVMVASNGLGQTLIAAKGSLLHKILVGRIGGVIPAQTVWMLVIAVFLWLLLNRHKIGCHIYFTGDNAQSARVMGVRVNMIKMFVFTQLGLFAAFAGVLASMEVTYFWPTLGEGYMLPVMASVFVGGTSVFGGTGTIYGTFIGALIIGCLEAGIVAMGLTGFWTQLIYGLVIVVSLSTYSILRKRS